MDRIFIPSRWKLSKQVRELCKERKRLEDRVEALETVAEEVVDTCAFAWGMSFNYEHWVRAILLPMAREALTEKT